MSDSPAMPAASASMPATIGVLGPKRAMTRGATTTMQHHDRDGHRQQGGAARRRHRSRGPAAGRGSGRTTSGSTRRPAGAGRGWRPARFGVRKMPSRISGSRRAAWMATNAASSSEPAGDDQQRGRRAPAVLGRADDAEHRSAPGRRWRSRADKVDRAATRGRRGISVGVSGQREQRDGDVDVEHPRPRRPLGEDAAEEDAGGAAGRSRRAVDRRRPWSAPWGWSRRASSAGSARRAR